MIKYPNEYIKKEEYTILRITSDTYGVIDFLIDDDEVENIKQYHWCIHHIGKQPIYAKQLNYAMTNDKRLLSTYRLLHRLIMKPDKGYEVDHIDGNPLNMRKCNMRVCTHKQNGRNLSLSVLNTSGYKGVTWDKSCHKWMAHIRVNDKHITLGYFKDKEEAAKIREEAELKYFGKYSRLLSEETV